MGDVVGFQPRADRHTNEAHQQLADAFTAHLEHDPRMTGCVVVTLGADGLFCWSIRYKDGVQRRAMLKAIDATQLALDAVRASVVRDPNLRDGEEPPENGA